MLNLFIGGYVVAALFFWKIFYNALIDSLERTVDNEDRGFATLLAFVGAAGWPITIATVLVIKIIKLIQRNRKLLPEKEAEWEERLKDMEGIVLRERKAADAARRDCAMMQAERDMAEAQFRALSNATDENDGFREQALAYLERTVENGDELDLDDLRRILEGKNVIHA